MQEINRQIVKEAKDFVYHILDHHLPKYLVFHDKAHTIDVLKNVELIGEAYRYSDSDMNKLRICALFHDVGYSITYNGHEKESACIAKEFLTHMGIEKEIIQQVTRAIMTTKVPQNPKDNISKILCDADLMHLTYDNYFEQITTICKEVSTTWCCDRIFYCYSIWHWVLLGI